MVAVKKAYVDTSIGQIHYRHAGEGDPLLLIHHISSSSEIYETLMGLLADRLSVVAIDVPGAGLSAYPPHPYSISDYARIIRESLDALHITSTSIFGHYAGASIACELAASTPERINSLFLSGPVNFDAEESKFRLERVPPLSLKEDGSHLAVMWSYFSGLFPELDLVTRQREILWRFMAGPRITEFYEAAFGYDMAGRLPLIKAPTLVMTGEYDSFSHAVEPSAQLMKRARAHIVPGGATFLFAQQPQDIADIILDFLAEPGV